ncbi:MAG: hypothetical protein V1794_01505, partial [Candidatus Glassbacteria bacterium]
VQNDPVNRTDPKGLENLLWEWFRHWFPGLTEPIPGSAVEAVCAAAETSISPSFAIRRGRDA